MSTSISVNVGWLLMRLGFACGASGEYCWLSDGVGANWGNVGTVLCAYWYPAVLSHLLLVVLALVGCYFYVASSLVSTGSTLPMAASLGFGIAAFCFYCWLVGQSASQLGSVVKSLVVLVLVGCVHRQEHRSSASRLFGGFGCSRLEGWKVGRFGG